MRFEEMTQEEALEVDGGFAWITLKWIVPGLAVAAAVGIAKMKKK